MKLVVLESPNKKAKVSHYLGAGFTVEATAGHFRDLPTEGLGVDLSTFTPDYVVDPDKKGLVKKLQSLAASADQVLLASDADREGEAISWHLSEVLGLKKPMRLKYVEITEKALKDALANLTPLDQHLADAAQARRIIDRLYGYQVSPMLIRHGIGRSAGRVQTPTLHLVVARELEREAFKPTPYWTLAAHYANGLTARYASVGEDGKLSDTRLPSEAEANAIADRARNAPHTVQSIATKPVERKPKAPFTTSSLQQAASAQLGFKPDHTMRLAQSLFEAGHISYMRTDSVALSDEAINMARAFIAQDYPAALPDQPVRYKVKGEAQAAHEAIRPTTLDPSAIAGVTGDELALYNLIRARLLACQSKPAVVSQTTITITAADTTWRAVGSTIQFDGFLHYTAADEDSADKKDAGDEDAKLPPVAQGEVLSLSKLDVAGKTTKPPPRFTQATLIREMEKTGIGRPSTYASTLKTLFDRDYIIEQKKEVLPTPTGRLLDAVIGAALPELVATQTTADLEAVFDRIAEAQLRWKDAVRSWHGPFSTKLQAAEASIAAEAAKHPELLANVPQRPTAKPSGVTCPRCGAAELLIRSRKEGGTFLSCNSYKSKQEPGCGFTANADAQPHDQPCPKCGGLTWISTDQNGTKAARCVSAACGATIHAQTTQPCFVCGAPMLDKGEYLGCSNYKGKDIPGSCGCRVEKKALTVALKTGKKCPKCQSPVVKKHPPGRDAFYGCVAYPKCNHAEFSKPKRK